MSKRTLLLFGGFTALVAVALSMGAHVAGVQIPGLEVKFSYPQIPSAPHSNRLNDRIERIEREQEQKRKQEAEREQRDARLRDANAQDRRSAEAAAVAAANAAASAKEHADRSAEEAQNARIAALSAAQASTTPAPSTPQQPEISGNVRAKPRASRKHKKLMRSPPDKLAYSRHHSDSPKFPLPDARPTKIGGPISSLGMPHLQQAVHVYACWRPKQDSDQPCKWLELQATDRQRHAWGGRILGSMDAPWALRKLVTYGTGQHQDYLCSSDGEFDIASFYNGNIPSNCLPIPD